MWSCFSRTHVRKILNISSQFSLIRKARCTEEVKQQNSQLSHLVFCFEMQKPLVQVKSKSMFRRKIWLAGSSFLRNKALLTTRNHKMEMSWNISRANSGTRKKISWERGWRKLASKEVQINCMIVVAIVFRKVDLQARERKRGESARGRNMNKYKSVQSFPEEDGALRGKDFTYSGLSKDWISEVGLKASVQRKKVKFTEISWSFE